MSKSEIDPSNQMVKYNDKSREMVKELIDKASSNQTERTTVSLSKLRLLLSYLDNVSLRLDLMRFEK